MIENVFEVDDLTSLSRRKKQPQEFRTVKNQNVEENLGRVGRSNARTNSPLGCIDLRGATSYWKIEFGHFSTEWDFHIFLAKVEHH